MNSYNYNLLTYDPIFKENPLKHLSKNVFSGTLNIINLKKLNSLYDHMCKYQSLSESNLKLNMELENKNQNQINSQKIHSNSYIFNNKINLLNFEKGDKIFNIIKDDFKRKVVKIIYKEDDEDDFQLNISNEQNKNYYNKENDNVENVESDENFKYIDYLNNSKYHGAFNQCRQPLNNNNNNSEDDNAENNLNNIIIKNSQEVRNNIENIEEEENENHYFNNQFHSFLR
jgi:hypothetical protein